MKYRIEKDSMGELRVPAEALYGAQTQRAVENFPISGLTMPTSFIRALGLVKAACARANRELGLLDTQRAEAIEQAAMRIAQGQHADAFVVDVFQTGSGTSSNMNANEVIARLASQTGVDVHPNDHVNMSQSSNDVIPTTIRVAAVNAIEERLLPALAQLRVVIRRRAVELDGVVKTGRTHLMDAMPVRFGQVLEGWAAQLDESEQRIRDNLPRLRALPQGGTAVGTGINAPTEFSARFCKALSTFAGREFQPMDNFFAGLGAQDAAVEASAQLRGLAIVLTKIANDLRWMNSGPLAGLGEISLPSLQPGSSIMPGKVNPVIPEAVLMVCAQVQGNDATISLAGQSGNFELNVMLPVMAYNLQQSIELLANAMIVLADKAIAGFKVNEDRLVETLARNPILVTALNPVIGYELGAAIAKRAYEENRPLIDVALEMTDLDEARLRELLDPTQLTKGGIQD
ncbi:MAG TPA: class II fumarate hydratase [Halothiobacillaceae bacterium]|nr:class II fumarate hydratase [Halothiobacillaceae bacterium]